MDDHLRLSVDLDSDGTAQLFAEVRANGFVGRSSAWINPEELVTLGAVLQSFPLTGRAGILGGYWSRTLPLTLEQEHVSLSFYVVGNRGQVGCGVRLAQPMARDARVESQHSVRVELLTSYAELQRFGPALAGLASGACVEAVLHAV